MRGKLDVTLEALRAVMRNEGGAEAGEIARRALVEIGAEVVVEVEVVVHLRRSGPPPKSRAARIGIAAMEDRGWMKAECGLRMRITGGAWSWEVKYMEIGEKACAKCIGARRRRRGRS